MDRWTHWFPFDSFRPQQEEALCRVVEAFEEAPCVLLEGETGLGKSGIALALARYYESAYISTVEKQLQDQYYRDFPSHLALLKGKNTYACGKSWEADGVPIHYMADKAPCGLNAPSKKSVSEQCALDEICPYLKARGHALNDAPITLMNFSNLLLFSMMGLPKWKREIAIFDEAHELPSSLYGFAEVPFTLRAFSIARRHLTTVQLEKLEVGFSSLGEVKEFCEGCLPMLKARLRAGAISPEEEMEVERLKGHTKRIETLLEHMGEGRRFVLRTEAGGGSVVSPLFVHHVAPLAFTAGKRILLMSATIPDPATLARELGIEKYVSIKVESVFPPENRPIFVLPVGSMAYAHQETTFPKVVEYTKALLRRHEGEKGLIHTFNYNIARKLREAIGDVNGRLLYQTPQDNKSELVARHIAARDGTVLVGPGFSKGVDLKYDLCSFMLILKTPNADIKNPLVAELMRNDPAWYSLQTVITITQMLGRGFRALDDRCTVYVLDEFFKRVYAERRELFPQNIRQSVVFL
jgi:Rad3-related DNA helicase